MCIECVFYVSTVEFDFSLPGVTSMSLDPHKVRVYLYLCTYYIDIDIDIDMNSRLLYVYECHY